MTTIYQQHNLLRIKTKSARALHELKKLLTYKKAKYNATHQQRAQHSGAHIVWEKVECFDFVDVSGEQHLIAPAGYFSRIVNVFNKVGIEYTSCRLDDLLSRKAFVQHWENLDDFDWRYQQKETLKIMLGSDRGQLWQATGTGKSWLMVPFCMVLSKANIVITTKHLQVLHDHFTRLSQHMGDVGIICSGKNIADRRVMCVSAGSLHRLNHKKVDVLIADEHHELGTDNFIAKLSSFKNSRMYGLSANVGDRTDGSDFELEGVFGQVINKLSYQEGVENSMVVPIEVTWHTVSMDKNPAEGKEGIFRKKYGIWRNKVRNQIIADVANQYLTDQVLITVETVEHACYLKQLLPDFQLCYSVSEESNKTVENMYSNGVLSELPNRMTEERLFNLKKDFELGIAKKVIATSVWNRGVNFHQLQVLIRADGAANAVADTQIPGRLARLSSGKNHGVLVDFMDEFDHSLHLRSKKRYANYKSKGWSQNLPSSQKTRSSNVSGIQTNSRNRNKTG